MQIEKLAVNVRTALHMHRRHLESPIEKASVEDYYRFGGASHYRSIYGFHPNCRVRPASHETFMTPPSPKRCSPGGITRAAGSTWDTTRCQYRRLE